MTVTSGSPALPRRALGDLGAAAALLGFALLLYGRAIGIQGIEGLGGPGFWWSDDDFFHLRVLSTYGPGEIALDPAVWQRLPFRMLTPLLFHSLQLDAALWGLAPAAFYLHQVIALGLAAVALHAVLRLWLPLPWAAFGATLFLLGPAVASLVPLLAIRHYVEALLLGLLATAAFVIAVRRKSIGWSWASALLGFLAMTAKEIAVPLPALLVLLPAGTFRERLRAALPYAPALALYLAYRAWMLGTLVGGYGFAVLPGSWPALALALPGKVAAQMAGGDTRGPAGWTLLAVWLVLLGLAAAARAPGAPHGGTWRVAGLTAAGLLLALLPVLPVSQEMAPRYAMSAWLAVAVSSAAAGRRLATSGGRGRAAALGLAAAALAAAGLANRAAWAEESARAGRKAAENQFLLRMAPDGLLRHPLDRPAALRELGWLRERQLGLAPAASWFYDDLYLSSPAAAGKRVWGFDPAAGRVVEVTGRVPALRARHRAAVRPAAPLSAAFRSTGAAVFWRLGPHPEPLVAPGTARWRKPGPGYALVFGDGQEVAEVPRRAGFQRPVRKIALKVRYTAPAGWITYSPELVLDFEARPDVRWNRPARHGSAAVSSPPRRAPGRPAAPR
jgi:hypothetical protein